MLPADSILSESVTEEPGTGLIVLKSANRCFVWLVGTTNAAQGILQGSGNLGGPIELGGYSGMEYWFSGARDAYKLMAALGIPADMPLTLCGHSMGGAIVSTMAARFRVQSASRDVQILTFGCPRPGDSRMKKLLATCRVVQIRNSGDVVPWTAPHQSELGYLSLLLTEAARKNLDRWESASGQIVLTDTGEKIDGEGQEGTLESLAAVVIAWNTGQAAPLATAHSMTEYLRRLALR
jgi:hypothetical protein